jgi:4-amino-4-deoxy-L-arabinose transferase-like glycosyltransferase
MLFMLMILVPILFISLWLILFNRRRAKGIRRTFLETSLILFGFIAVSTEVFSLFNAIAALNFILAWCGGVLFLFAKFRREIRSGAYALSAEFRENLKSVPKFYLVLIVFVYLATLVLALVSPPNTYDSMTYHMARVGHWIQNGSVAFYPTAILRQLYNPPLAEYGILHFQMLSGSDYFANLVQWFALVACGATASLIVKAIGRDAKVQAFAAFLCTTIPAAIVQSTGTQKDRFASVFVLAFFYFFIAATESNGWSDFLWTGAALGLAILAKGTAYVYCFPTGLFFVVVHFLALDKKELRVRFVKQIGVVLFIALAFNAGHYARSAKLFGEPVSTAGEPLRNKNLTPKMVLSNLARNYALHLATTSDALNATFENAFKATFGDELKNPDSTWSDNQFFIVYSGHEDRVGNFVHLWLITFALLGVFLIRREPGAKYVYGAAFAVAFGFLLFSILLKWQIWGSRLQLSLFMLGSVLAAVVIGRLVPRVMVWLAVLVFLFSLPFVYYSDPRRIWEADGSFALDKPRRQQYFKNLPDIEPHFVEATDFIKNQSPAPEEVGLHIEFNDYEYPFWFLLKKDFSQKPNLRHVGITNVSAKLAGTRPLPEFVISIRPETVIEGIEYKVVWAKDVVKVLQKK